MATKRPNQNQRPNVDRAGRTPLHYAAADGDTNRVRELLASGADSNAADGAGWTPLHFAAQQGAAEVISLLLGAGAVVDSRDSSGNTPLLRAVFESRGQGEVIRLLRQAGADPYVENKHGSSPLKLARTISNYDVGQFFGDLPGS
jgi:ankyrin repeat protein